MLGGDADVEKETSTPHHEFVEAVGNNHSEKENHSITYLITIQLLCEITEPAVEQLPKRNCYTINTKVRMKFRKNQFLFIKLLIYSRTQVGFICSARSSKGKWQTNHFTLALPKMFR